MLASFIRKVSQYAIEISTNTSGNAPFGLIIHRYKDLDIENSHPFICSFNYIEYTFGLLREDGTEKPGWTAYKEVIKG